MRSRARGVWFLLGALLVLVGWAAYDGDVDGDPDFFHEGERLAAYDTVVRGGLPFRDYFVPHGLGEDVVKGYLACKLLGPSVASLRRVGSNAFRYRGLLPWLGFLSVGLASLMLVSRRTLAVGAIVVLSAVLAEATDRQLLGFVAVAFTGAYLVHGRLRWLVAAGAAASLALLYSLEVGLYATGSIAATLAAERLLARRNGRSGGWGALVALAAGLSAVVIPFLLWCAGQGIIKDLGHNLWVQVGLRGRLWPSHYPALAGPSAGFSSAVPFPLVQSLILYYLLPAMLVATLVMTLVKYRGMPPVSRQRLLLASILACCFWGTVVGRADEWHVAFAVPAAVLLAAVALDAPLPGPPPLRRAMALAGLAVLVSLGSVGHGGALARKVGAALRGPDRALVSSSIPRLRGVRIAPDLKNIVDPLVAEIDRLTPPGQPVLNLTPYGLLLFLAERESAVRYASLAHFGASQRLRDEVLEKLLHGGAPPRCVLTETGIDLGGDRLASWIRATYARVAVFGPVEVLAPRVAR